MNNLFAVYEEGDWSSPHRKQILQAICTSKRQAIKMAVDKMLTKKLILSVHIAVVKNQLNEVNYTTGYKSNFSLQEVKPNTFLN